MITIICICIYLIVGLIIANIFTNNHLIDEGLENNLVVLFWSIILICFIVIGIKLLMSKEYFKKA